MQTLCRIGDSETRVDRTSFRQFLQGVEPDIQLVCKMIDK